MIHYSYKCGDSYILYNMYGFRAQVKPLSFMMSKFK